MAKEIVTLHLRDIEPYEETISLLGNELHIRHEGCHSDLEDMAARIKAWDGEVDAIALFGVARTLRLGRERAIHQDAAKIFDVAQTTPVVDGGGVRDAIERWAIRLAAEAEPGIWSRKRVLMTPGLNHTGLAQALAQYAEEIHYADPILFFNLPGTALLSAWHPLYHCRGDNEPDQRDVLSAALSPTGRTRPTT
jgi:hypothetical protein